MKVNVKKEKKEEEEEEENKKVREEGEERRGRGAVAVDGGIGGVRGGGFEAVEGISGEGRIEEVVIIEDVIIEEVVVKIGEAENE